MIPSRTQTAMVTLLVALPGLPGVASPRDGSLLEKAQRFRRALVERHRSPEGLVLYRVDLDTLEADLRDGTYPDLADTPTFNGLFAATACTRARVDDGNEAREDADRALAGLELLLDVTGRPGLLARGVRRIRTPAPDEEGRRWFAGAPGFERFRWRGDASVDQYANGLLPAAWACRDLYPERSRRLVVGFAEHLLTHDLRIVDPDGRRTRFGDLSPDSGYGLNSIAQLTAYATFALSEEMDPRPAWRRARVLLRDRERVPARGRTTNVRVLGITNFSNELMSWNLYRVLIPMARRSGDPALPDLRHGIMRTWLRVRPDGNPYFIAVLCHVEPTECTPQLLAEARGVLERFPVEKRKLAPSARLRTLPRALLPGRKWRPRARHPVPMEIRPASSLEWKSSPYRLEAGTAPNIEYSGVDFLAAYWLLRSAEARLREPDPPDPVSSTSQSGPMGPR